MGPSIRSANPFGSWWVNYVQPVRRERTNGETVVRPRNWRRPTITARLIYNTTWLIGTFLLSAKEIQQRTNHRRDRHDRRATPTRRTKPRGPSPGRPITVSRSNGNAASLRRRPCRGTTWARILSAAVSTAVRKATRRAETGCDTEDRAVKLP